MNSSHPASWVSLRSNREPDLISPWLIIRPTDYNLDSGLFIGAVLAHSCLLNLFIWTFYCHFKEIPIICIIHDPDLGLIRTHCLIKSKTKSWKLFFRVQSKNQFLKSKGFTKFYALYSPVLMRVAFSVCFFLQNLLKTHPLQRDIYTQALQFIFASETSRIKWSVCLLCLEM